MAMILGHGLRGDSCLFGNKLANVAPIKPHQMPSPAPTSTSVSQCAPMALREIATALAAMKSNTKGLRFSAGAMKKVSASNCKGCEGMTRWHCFMKHRFANPVKLVLLQDPSRAWEVKCIFE